jgi:hypothetical protein
MAVATKFVEAIETPINKATGTRNHTVINDIDEAVMFVERGGTTLEYLTPGTVTKLYFDKDCHNLEEGDDVRRELMMEEGLNLIKRYVHGVVETDDIAVASRHRLVIKNNRLTWKTSFRYYVPKLAMEFQDIQYILKCHDDGFFDQTVDGPK